MTSGSDGQRLTDGDTTTCVNIQPQDGAVLQYELNINKACSHDNQVLFNVTVTTETNCFETESVFFTEVTKNNNCGKNGKNVKRCEMTESDVDEGNRVCSLRCECAESAEICQVLVYSGVTPKNIHICEIKVHY